MRAPILELTTGKSDNKYFYEIVESGGERKRYGYRSGYDLLDEAQTAGKKMVDEILERFE